MKRKPSKEELLQQIKQLKKYVSAQNTVIDNQNKVIVFYSKLVPKIVKSEQVIETKISVDKDTQKYISALLRGE